MSRGRKPRKGVTSDIAFALVPEWLIDSNVTAQAVRLYAVLSRYADRDGHAFPSRKTLAKRLQVKSLDTVDRALKELTDVHAVTISGRVDEAGDATSNLYVVHRTPPTGVAARIRPPRPKNQATPPEGCGDGGRTDAGTVAAQIVHEREPQEREPQEVDLPVDADAPTTPIRDDVDRLCARLADRIEANGSKRPTITKAWRDSARLLLDRDHRTEEQVARAIDWCQNDDFWRSNVLSMPTLRKQYDRLRLAAQRERETPRRGDIDWDAAKARADHIDSLNQTGKDHQ